LIRECPARANVPDLFKGDEVSNAARLSLVKVQIFYFTLTLVFALWGAVSQLSLDRSGVVENLPALSMGMRALLALSHAGYSTNKAVPH
jgi:hypothetical protein